MTIQYVQKDPYIKRIPTIVDLNYGVQSYDIDNLYPQRADEVRSRSFTLKSAVERLADFIKGQGFEDANLANLILNSEGMSGNELLDVVAQDKAPFVGIALHFKYNFNYRIAEITPLNWMFCRFGLPDERGNVWDIKYNTNWERDPYKKLTNTFIVESYPIFNPDPNQVKSEMDEYGIEDYPGQILYWTPKPGVYPKASFDAVFDNAQTQAEIGVFELSSIQNGFTASKIFKYPGVIEDEGKKTKIKEKLNEHKGARGANSIIVVEAPDGMESGTLVEDLQMQNTDKMFEFTSKNTRNAIRETLAMPAPLLGQLPENGMFNQQQMEDSYKYANAMTQGHRDQLERVFKKIMAYWKDPIQFVSFKIKQLQYGQDASATETTPNTAQPGATAQPGQTAKALPRPEMNEALSKLSGTQDAQLQRIIRQYDSGKLSYDRALRKMTMTFPITEVEAKDLLGPEEETIAA